MNSNYLTDKYPDVGYKSPIRYKRPSVSSFGMVSPEEASRNNIANKAYNEVNKLPYTKVCKCGEEWESTNSTYQEGCYPYIEAECSDCNIKNRIAEDKAIQAKKVKERVDSFDQQIPPRYRGKLKQTINKDLLTSTCSIIWGGFGTGKTWEAYTVAKELITSGEIKRFKLLTEIDLLNDLKDGFDDMQYKIKQYKEIDLLILDEAGKNNDSDFNKAQLFGILNHRYDWEKKTILICNARDKQEIRNLLPTATLDRFRECIVEMNGNSKRYRS